MAFSGKIGFVSSVSAHSRTEELSKRCRTVIFSGILVHNAALPGTGLENPPPLAISPNLLQFLKYMDLKSVGLGLDCVPFHFGWKLVEWRSKLSVLESNYSENLEICDETKEEEHLEVFGPQIELNLENPSDMSEPAVEVAGVAPTVVVVVEEESSVELLEVSASVEKEKRDQAVGTVEAPVLEVMKERTGAEPILMDVKEIRSGDEPVREAEELRTGEEPVPADVEMGT